MALNNEARSVEQQNALLARFKTAQSEPPADIEVRKEIQREVQNRIYAAALAIDVEIENSREKSLALTHLEEALMWAGKAIFS